MEPWQTTLCSLLDAHNPADEQETAHLRHIRDFVASQPACFERATLPGHITGSAFIYDRRQKMLLLHHHMRLNRWLQMGGHDAGERNALATALREGREESGLERLEPWPGVLDVDVHAIPERKTEPAHDHLDVRFLVLADASAPLQMDPTESLELRWFPLDQALQMIDAGGQRAMRKLKTMGLA